MRIWHISDTHGHHKDLTVPENIDLIIHSGDACNYREPDKNLHELYDFLDWWHKLNAIRVFVPGNHDTFIERKEKFARELFNRMDSYILINETIELFGLKIWGSPITPRFNDWAYNRDRGKIIKTWEKIPQDVDIIVTHGPPMGILDVSEDKDHNIHLCGCSALSKVIPKTQAKLHLFGHIHDFKHYKNRGVLIRDEITYSNASCVVDGKDELSSNGNILKS